MASLVRCLPIERWLDTFDGFASDEVVASLVQEKQFLVGSPPRCDLSFWRFEGDLHEWRDSAIVALALSPLFREPPTGLDVAWVEESQISDLGIAMDATPGITVVPALQGCHRDLTALDSGRLSALARLLKGALLAGHHFSVTTAEVLDCCAAALRVHRIKPDNLKAPWKGVLAQRLAKP